MAWWIVVLRALWLFLPAYVANMAPVFVAKIVPKWNAPIDGGRIAKDGQRVLGAGKTWRGLVGGALAGGLIALLMAFLAPPHGNDGIFAGLDFAFKGFREPVPPCLDTADCPDHPYAYSPLWAVFFFGYVVGAMALVGDFVKSYFKRRRGKEGGAPWFPFDQLDFVVFGLLGMTLAAPLLPDGWVMHALLDDWITLATLLLLTPALHLLVNRIGFWLGLKKVPW